MVRLLDKIGWSWFLLACVTLGLAPWSPPHIVEKLGMLVRGDLKRAIDWFDLLFHGLPWALLLLKVAATATRSGRVEP